MKFATFAITLTLTLGGAAALALAIDETGEKPAAAAADGGHKHADKAADKTADKPTTAPSTTPSTQAAAGPVNKKCPVSGDPIDPKGQTFTYKGKKIGFCCDECIDSFKKEPEKYAKDIK